MSDATGKTCTVCKTVKPSAEFGRSARAKDGLRSQCRTCNAARVHASYIAAGPARVITCGNCGGQAKVRNPRAMYCSDRCKTRAAEKRRTEKADQRGPRPCDKCGTPVLTRVGKAVCESCRVDRRDGAERDRRRTLRKYGITEADWDRMLTEQGGRCAICRTDTPGGRGERWHIDHSHATDKVRGLLCHNCNVGIGNFQDAPALLRSAAAYLEATS
jgi:hypothetical protein